MSVVKIPEGVPTFTLSFGGEPIPGVATADKYVRASDLPAIFAANLPQASEGVEDAIDALVQECYYECDGYRNRDAETSSYIDALHDAVAADRQRAVDDAIAKERTTPMFQAVAAGDGTLHGAIDHWQQRAEAAEQREKELRELLAVWYRLNAEGRVQVDDVDYTVVTATAAVLYDEQSAVPAVAVLASIESALTKGYTPAEILDENSPIRGSIRAALGEQHGN